MERATLVGAFMVGADLSGANLDGAHLERATLIGANLNGAQLDGASLAGVVWSAETVWSAGHTDRVRAASAEFEPGRFRIGRDGVSLGSTS